MFWRFCLITNRTWRGVVEPMWWEKPGTWLIFQSRTQTAGIQIPAVLTLGKSLLWACLVCSSVSGIDSGPHLPRWSRQRNERQRWDSESSVRRSERKPLSFLRPRAFHDHLSSTSPSKALCSRPAQPRAYLTKLQTAKSIWLQDPTFSRNRQSSFFLGPVS